MDDDTQEELRFLDYAKSIKSAAEEELCIKNKRAYKIKHNSAYVLVRLFYETKNGEEHYYDYCEYQRHDGCAYVQPVLWSVSDLKSFYELFVAGKDGVNLPVEIISPRELKTLKPKRFYNKNNKAFFTDQHGYFYLAYKWDLPNKRNREEHEKNSGSADYRKKAPEDRNVIFRLPYFQLKKELEYERDANRDCGIKAVAHIVARKWCGMFEGYKQFGNGGSFDNADWVEELILAWAAKNDAK